MPYYSAHPWFHNAALRPQKTDTSAAYASLKSSECSSETDIPLYEDIPLESAGKGSKSTRRSLLHYCHAVVTLVLLVIAISQALSQMPDRFGTKGPVPDCELSQASIYAFNKTNGHSQN